MQGGGSNQHMLRQSGSHQHGGNNGTRHVNTRFHFVRELHDDTIMCVHREGGENESDIMTKNPASAEFEKHSSKMWCKVPQKLLEKVNKEEGCQNVLSSGHSFRWSAEQQGTWWMTKEQHGRLGLMVGRMLAVEECEKNDERRCCC